MRISLVLATLGTRHKLIERLLSSLSAGTHRDIELIVVDQSLDDRLERMVSDFGAVFPFVHLRCSPGLSKARNRGLERVTGDIVGFPDDDCWYPDWILASVAQRFRDDSSLGGVTGRPIDGEGRSSIPRRDLQAGPVTKFNIWRRATSIALFLTREAVARVGRFDESLGVGSGTPWGAAEDIDYPLRALAAGFSLYYDPGLVVYHPSHVQALDSADLRRAESYAAGMGRVLRKHSYPRWFVLYQVARPLAGTGLSILSGQPGKARYHMAVVRGRVRGWRSVSLPHAYSTQRESS